MELIPYLLAIMLSVEVFMARLTDIVKSVAETLTKEGKTANFKQLADSLNTLDIKTTDGNTYSSSRGMAKVVKDTYNDLYQRGDFEGAKKVADAFTDKNGNHSWNK